MLIKTVLAGPLRNAKPREKKYKLFDGNGLYLEVRPNGGRYFRWRYRFADKGLTIGTYPRVTLAKARRTIVTAQDDLDNDIDPAAKKQVDKLTAKLMANTTFEGIAPRVIQENAKPVGSDSPRPHRAPAGA